MASDLIVVENWRKRAAPRDNPPNGNPPVGSVGPDVPAGFGDTHALYDAENPPAQVQAWNGWPIGWQTPNWNEDEQIDIAKRVSTLWSCVDLNTRELASFPTYGMQGLSMVPLPSWANNPEPSVYSDWTEAAKQIFNTYQTCGEAILWCLARYKDGLSGGLGSVARFVVLNPQWVNIERKNGEVVYEFEGKQLDSADVCHIKYQSMPGNLRGIGPMEWAGRAIASAVAMERYGANLATKGGIPWGIIKHPRRLNGKESADLQGAWISAAGNRMGAPAVLSGGIELEMLTISPKEMAMLDVRMFDETRIAAAFGVPPFLVGLPQPAGMTYANATGLFDFHWRATLRPMAQAVASAISRWALPSTTRMEFNRDPYVQASPKERAETYQLLFNLVDEKGNRAITVDEIRMAERYLPNNPTETLEQLAQGTVTG